MSKYNTTKEIWKTFGIDTYNLVRNEEFTADGTKKSFELTGKNLVSGSDTVYVDGNKETGYASNLEDGTITFTIAPVNEKKISVNYMYADIEDAQLQNILNQADEELESLTNRNFDLTTTSEYCDVEKGQKEFWTQHYPVNTLVCKENASDNFTSPDFREKQEGFGGDYFMDELDKRLGHLEFIRQPFYGKRRLKFEYTYGYETIPNLVKELHALLVMRKLANSTIYKAIFKGRDAFTPVRLSEIERQIRSLTALLRKDSVNRI